MNVKSYPDGKGPSTPWESGQQVKTVARGVAEVGTASHGGMRVSRGLATRRMKPEILACAIERSGYFWFEEDCAYALVVLSMPELFEAKMVESAKASAKTWNPDEYTVLTGEPVVVEESYTLQRRAFEAETKDKFVVRCAWGDWEDDVPKGMVKVFSRRDSDGAERYGLVNAVDYNTRRSKFGYVLADA